MPSTMPMPGAQDGDEDDLLALQHDAAGAGHRGLDLDLDQRQIAGHLVGQQHADLGDQVAEGVGAEVLLPQQGQLVLHERVVDDVDFGHGGYLRIRCRRSRPRGAGGRRGVAPGPAPGRPARCRPRAPWPAAGRRRPAPGGARSSAAIRSSRATVSARHSTTSGEPTAWTSAQHGRLDGAPARPRRGTGRRCGIRPGRSARRGRSTRTPAAAQRLEQRVGQPLRQLVKGDQPELGVGPGVAEVRPPRARGGPARSGPGRRARRRARRGRGQACRRRPGPAGRSARLPTRGTGPGKKRGAPRHHLAQAAQQRGPPGQPHQPGVAGPARPGTGGPRVGLARPPPGRRRRRAGGAARDRWRRRRPGRRGSSPPPAPRSG